jgi:hypothetical protein
MTVRVAWVRVHGRLQRGRRAVIVAAVLALLGASSAWAFQALPSTGQVNDDLAAGIDKARSVSGEDPANADLVGGSLTAGAIAVPWVIFRQSTAGHAQVFVRSFAGGAWTTRGSGTVGGASSASPAFAGSLNFQQGADAEAPSIDFAGAGRTVPWASWYEDTTATGFNANNIFASRFDNSGDANQGKWLFGGQNRLSGAGVPIPSLNIHTNADAGNPSVAGGSTASSTPAPWVAWDETTTAPVSGKHQIFVERSIGPGAANCDGVTPAGVADISGHVPAVGGFCWQETGIARVGGGGTDPSLNVDPSREALEPDIVFAGAGDNVPWVVWYEEGASTLGLHANSMVFAAKASADADPGTTGGFAWTAVGSGLQGTLDTTSVNSFGACAASAANEASCSLNANTTAAAQDPRVAAGTMTAGTPTVPWVTWDETVAGKAQIFVATLVGSGSSASFQIVNGGAPISTGANDSTHPDVTFSGNTPYVTWSEDTGGGVERAFAGHFVNAAAPTFVLDESDVALTPTAQADVRVPISSACTADPFDQDGAACQGGAVGTPFLVFTSGTAPAPLGLFSDTYQPTTPVTAAATAVTASGATLNGTVDPGGASANVFFQYGPTAAYGQATAIQASGPADSSVAFSAAVAGLAAGTTLHYRVVATTDFGTFAGADQSVTTRVTAAPAAVVVSPTVTLGAVKVSGTRVAVHAVCTGSTGTTCQMRLALSVSETLRRNKVVAVSARKARRKHKLVGVGTASFTMTAGQVATLHVSLNAVGGKLLRHHSPLAAKLKITQSGGGATITLAGSTVTFKRHR